MFAIIISALSNFIHLILGINTPQNFPTPLSATQENEYFKQLEKGDTQARQELILHNLRLVSHIVRKYYATAKNQEDLVSIGTIGLIKAVDTYKVSGGVRFATYAAKCIQNAILSQRNFIGKITYTSRNIWKNGTYISKLKVVGT